MHGVVGRRSAAPRTRCRTGNIGQEDICNCTRGVTDLNAVPECFDVDILNRVIAGVNENTSALILPVSSGVPNARHAMNSTRLRFQVYA